MKRTFGTAGAVILGLVAIIAIGAIALGIRWIFAEPTGAVEQREQTIGDGAYRIQAYEAFYEECASARTLQQNLDNARTQAENVDDPTRRAQLDANVTALANQLNAAVNDYNAHARETDTRGHFLASDLPYALDATQEIRCDA